MAEGVSSGTGSQRWADELNQLAMAVETLAKITPTTPLELEKEWRQRAFETARAVRERIAELIPDE